MMIIEVADSKVEKMSSCVEEILNKGGKLMHMLEELNSSNYDTKNYIDQDEDDYGKRDYYTRRNRNMKPDYYRYY